MPSNDAIAPVELLGRLLFRLLDLKALENSLAGKEYLVGNRFTVAGTHTRPRTYAHKRARMRA